MSPKGRSQHTIVIQFDVKTDPAQIPDALRVLARGRGFVRASAKLDAQEFGRLKVMLRKHYPHAVIRSLS